MSSDFISVMIKTIIYLLFTIGVFLIVYEKRYKYIEWYKIKKRLNHDIARKSKVTGLLIQSEEMINVVFNRRIKVKHLFLSSLLAAIAVFVAGIGTLAFPVLLIVSMFSFILPYILLRIRFESLRRRSSYEGELLVSSVLISYRINDFNMIEAIEQLLSNDSDLKHTRMHMYRMVTKIRSAQSNKEIEAAADMFAYSIDTNWSRLLAMNIKIACIKGTNMSLALEEVLKQLREAKSLEEERKRLNSETKRMTFLMVPLSYLGTLITSVKYLNIPLEKLISNQISNKQGLLMLSMIILMFLINFVMIEFIGGKKFDF